jgi:hypothetical protein
MVSLTNSIILVVLCFAFIFADSHRKAKMFPSGVVDGLIKVRSKRDGFPYLVIPGRTAREAADTLSIITDFASDAIDCLWDANPEDPRVLLLHERLNKTPLRFRQFQPARGEPVAVTHEKGKGGVQICLYHEDGTKAKLPGIKSVVLHEITHLMEKDDSPLVDGFSVHGQAFKDTEAFVNRCANKSGLIQQGGAVGYKYCNITIPDPEIAT